MLFLVDILPSLVVNVTFVYALPCFGLSYVKGLDVSIIASSLTMMLAVNFLISSCHIFKQNEAFHYICQQLYESFLPKV